MPKLTDLDAVLVKFISWPGRQPQDDWEYSSKLQHVQTIAEADGIRFECPDCASGHWILVYFAGRGLPDELRPEKRWEVTGSSVEDIGLFPSVDCSPSPPCTFHRVISNGTC